MSRYSMADEQRQAREIDRAEHDRDTRAEFDRHDDGLSAREIRELERVTGQRQHPPRPRPRSAPRPAPDPTAIQEMPKPKPAKANPLTAPLTRLLANHSRIEILDELAAITATQMRDWRESQAAKS